MKSIIRGSILAILCLGIYDQGFSAKSAILSSVAYLVVMKLANTIKKEVV